MTVLPTVRRQLEAAAEGRRGRLPGWRGLRLPVEVVLTAVGVAAAVGVAGLVVVAFGHSTAPTPPAISKPPLSSVSAAGGRVLAANGIGATQFGEEASRAGSQLARLFGHPEGRYVPSICGFDGESYWIGLHVRPKGVRGERLFRSELWVYFKRSRFVGYAYYDLQALSRGPLADETHVPLNSEEGRQVLRGPRLSLATLDGLRLGDQVARAQRLYGQAFLQTTRPQGTPPKPRLGLVHIWQLNTPTGQVSGSIDGAKTSQDFYGDPRPIIGSITAGQTPNTPCH
jgi:hypothetical protein